MIARWETRKLRGQDPEGDGSFAASRGGKRHKGVDYCYDPGEIVKCPVDGIVTRTGRCYTDSTLYKLVEILSHKGMLLWRFLYVDPEVKAGEKVVMDQTIGTAQDISARYSQKMKNHVHVEMNVDVSKMLGGG
jgi:hypothetical protein